MFVAFRGRKLRFLALLPALAALALVPVARAAGYDPVDPSAFSWQQHPGAQVPLAKVFTDCAGKPAILGDLASDAPVILDLAYFHCPSLCGVARGDLLSALQESTLVAGRDYTLIVASIDPAETVRDAAAARASDIQEFPGLAPAALHYLTGDRPAIDAVEHAVGFRAHYDERFRQFLHPSGLVFLTRGGVVSSYLLGVGYRAGDVRAAIVRARDGGIARAALPILLLCFHFDSTTGRYTLAIYKVLRLMGLVTVAGIVGLVFVLSRTGGGRVPGGSV